MKKISSIVLMFLLGGVSLTSNKAGAQALEQGQKSLDIYYGFASLGAALTRGLNAETDAEWSYLGPVGTKFEYMASDKIGIGFDINYTSFDGTWTSYDEIDSTTYTYKASTKITRIMPRFNIHFGGSENFDGYFGIAGGYRSANYSIKRFVNGIEDPTYTDESSGFVPYALRFAIGGRFYLSDALGFHMELGFGGGSLIHTGVSFKF